MSTIDMANGRQWIRLYTKVLDDPKVQTLPDGLFRFWIECLLIAGKSSDGVLPSARFLQVLCRNDARTVQKRLQKLAEKKLIDETPTGFKMHDWEQHQWLSDFSRDRMKRHRDGHPNVTVTPPDNRYTDTDSSSTSGNSLEVERNTHQENAAAAPLVPAPPTIGGLSALLAVFADFGRGCADHDLKTCERIWTKLTDADRRAASAGVAASIVDWRTRPSEKIPQPWNYLSGRYWERALTRRQPQRQPGKFEGNFRQAAARFVRETSAGGKP